MNFISPYQPYVTWKGAPDVKTIIVSQNIKNDKPESDQRKMENCAFNANPIKHYRKHLINQNSRHKNTTSGQSLIKNLDAPGFTSITALTEETSIIYQAFLHDRDIYGNDYAFDETYKTPIPICCNPQNLVIKTAKTLLDKKYASSYREKLHRDEVSRDSICREETHKEAINIKTGSARTASLKYQYCPVGKSARRCVILPTDYNNRGNLNPRCTKR